MTRNSVISPSAFITKSMVTLPELIRLCRASFGYSILPITES
jgi:hypothetical protein